MTLLVIQPDDNPGTTTLETSDPAIISAELNKRGVKFEQWNAGANIEVDADSDAVLAAYASDVQRLGEQGYDTVDVLRLNPDPADPEWTQKALGARGKFLSEHTHDDDEVRFFVEGKGCFYLRIDGEILMTVCEKNDLIWVPAGTNHWFDMGTEPDFVVIRFFRIPEGWVGNFTGDSISESFPTLDELVAV